MNKNDFSAIKTDICIIGGGASGMMAAISAYNCNNSCTISIIEHTDRVGKKILSTGNGKCNLGNTKLSVNAYSGSFNKPFLADAFCIFGTSETISFFNSIGLFIRNKDGYLYPYSETATSVLDTLRLSIRKNNISIYDSFETNNISVKDNLFFIKAEDGRSIVSKALILATGGKSAPKTGSDGSGYILAKRLGLNIVDPVPALLKVRSDSFVCKTLEGVRAKGNVKLFIDNTFSDITDFGEIQFTKEGLSGIPVFNISRHIYNGLKHKKSMYLCLDLMPEYTEEDLIININYTLNNASNINVEELFVGLLNKKIILAALKLCGIDINLNAKDLTKKQISLFVKTIKNMKFNISGGYDFDISQVSAGGIDFSEVDEKLMSKKINNLYFVGEILDIDGICGGYNLQWAWTSGYIAGTNAANKLW